MDTRGSAQSLLAIALTVLLVVSIFSGTGAVMATDPPDDQVTRISKNVSVWERAPLPLRADKSTAATSVELPLLNVVPPNEGELPLDYQRAGAFTPGQSTTLTFQSKTGAAALDNEQITLVAAKLSSNTSAFTEAFRDLPRQRFNETASFETVGETTTNSEGTAQFSYTFTDPGNVVFLAFTEQPSNTGVRTVDGDIAFDGNVTLVGTDQAVVQDTTSTVTTNTSSVTAGNAVEFTAQSNLGTSPNGTQHLVLVYNSDTFTGAEVTFELTEDFGSTLDLESASTVKTTIGNVSGVSRTRGEFTAGGVTASDGNFSGTQGVVALAEDLRTAVADGQLVPTTQTQPPAPGEDPVTLYASATAVNGSSSETLVVETLPEWSSGSYSYLHVAVQDDEVSSSTGTVEVTAPTTPTPTPTPTPTDTPTATPTDTPTATPTDSPTDAPPGGGGDDGDDGGSGAPPSGGGGGGGAPAPTPTATSAPPADTPTTTPVTASPPPATATPTPTPTDTPTLTPTDSPTPTETPTVSQSPTTTPGGGGGLLGPVVILLAVLVILGSAVAAYVLSMGGITPALARFQ